MLMDKNGAEIKEGVMIQFDDDYFGHGMQRTVKLGEDGILGFEAVPNRSTELCYIKSWLKEIEVVTESTHLRTVGKHITLDGKRYMA